METFPGTSVFKNRLKNTLHIKMLLKHPTGGRKMNTSNKSFTVILNAHLDSYGVPRYMQNRRQSKML